MTVQGSDVGIWNILINQWINIFKGLTHDLANTTIHFLWFQNLHCKKKNFKKLPLVKFWCRKSKNIHAYVKRLKIFPFSNYILSEGRCSLCQSKPFIIADWMLRQKREFNCFILNEMIDLQKCKYSTILPNFLLWKIQHLA